MPINFKDLKDDLYDWAITVVPTGMPVIYWQPNAPRPLVPYLTLFISSVVSINEDWSSPESDLLGEIQMKGDRQFTLEVQAYGGDPLTTIENIRTSLQKQTVLDTLRANGIAVYQALTINDITNLIDTQFEQRAQIDILMGIAQTYTDNPGYFEQLEIEEEILDQTGSIVYNDTITIP